MSEAIDFINRKVKQDIAESTSLDEQLNTNEINILKMEQRLNHLRLQRAHLLEQRRKLEVAIRKTVLFYNSRIGDQDY